MGVHDAANGREMTIKLDVCRHVGRGPQLAVDKFAVTVDHDHVFRLHRFVRDAARLDDDGTAFGIPAADVAPGEIDEAQFRQFEIGFQDLLFQFFEHDV